MTKRSQNVLTSRFIKNPMLKVSRLPFAIGLASVFLAGCTDTPEPPVINVDEYDNLNDCVAKHPNFADTCRAAFLRKLAQQEVESKLFKTPEQCIADNPGKELECLQDWEKAKQEAEVKAPRYASQKLCEETYAGCQPSSSGDFFMPLVTGYLLGSMNTSSIGGSDHRRIVSPVYTPAGDAGRRMTSGGLSVSTTPGTTVKMRALALNQRSTSSMGNRAPIGSKKAITKTTSRKGFGSTTKARSWGG